MEGVSLVDVKHESLLQLWCDRVMECRSSGKSIAVGILLPAGRIWALATMIMVGILVYGLELIITKDPMIKLSLAIINRRKTIKQ